MYGHDCAWGPGRKSGEHYMFMTYIYANHWRLIYIYINQYRRLMPICYLLMDLIQMIKKNQRGALMYTKRLDCFSAPLCLVKIHTIPDVHNVYMHGFSPRSAPSYSTHKCAPSHESSCILVPILSCTHMLTALRA